MCGAGTREGSPALSVGASGIRATSDSVSNNVTKNGADSRSTTPAACARAAYCPSRTGGLGVRRRLERGPLRRCPGRFGAPGRSQSTVPGARLSARRVAAPRELRTAQAGAPSGASADGASSSLVDPASSHMLVSKIKPCMSQCKPH
jgi:hypothetical protein